MGLSGVKKRSKLSHDPNNTAWSKSTTNFGHKILSKQGWKPGDYLGAENANHSEHYTAANASHIRVMLREDNLGLGAKIGGGNAETFGLSMFSGLLGRLNGKSEVELKEKQDQMRDAELRTWTGRKYGYMNFVSGGLLVGDKMEEKPMTTKSGGSSKKRKAEEEAVEETTQQEKEKKKKNKKRKSKPDQTTAPDAVGAENMEKSSKKDNRNGGSGRKVSGGPVQDDTESGSQAEETAKEEKRKRKERRRAEKASKVANVSSEDKNKARLKEEKRARKEERRKRKEEKRQKRATKEQATAQTSTSMSESEGTATPPVQANIGGRQAVRQRYIQSKRMASMDPQALKEIFMLQAKTSA